MDQTHEVALQLAHELASAWYSFSFLFPTVDIGPSAKGLGDGLAALARTLRFPLNCHHCHHGPYLVAIVVLQGAPSLVIDTVVVVTLLFFMELSSMRYTCTLQGALYSYLCSTGASAPLSAL